MRRGAVWAILLCACDRELSLPPPRTAPVLASVAPDSAFAGEQIVLKGTNLGAADAARVFVGGAAATMLLDPRADGSLVALVPQGLAAGKLDVSISTPQGQSALTALFTYLGLGHPGTLTLRGQEALSPRLKTIQVLDTKGYLIDSRHNLLLRADPFIGAFAGQRQLRVPMSASYVFGPPDLPWLFSAGEVGDPPNLHRYAYPFGAPAPAEACPAPRPPLGIPLPVSTTSFVAGNASGSADGTRLALPTGDDVDPSILLVDLSTCTPVSTVVALPGATSPPIWAMLTAAGEVIVLTVDQAFRVSAGPSPAVVAGDALPFPPGLTTRPALSPVENRLAFLDDGNVIWFVTWGAPGTAPLLVRPALFTYSGGSALSFTADGKRLFVVSDLVIAYDAATLEVVGSAKLEDRGTSVAPLPTGEMVVGSSANTGLYSRDGFLLREGRVPTPFTGVAVGAAGKPFFASKLDTQTFTPAGFHSVANPDAYSIGFDGISGGEGGAAGWSDETVYLRDEALGAWVAGPALGADRLVSWASRGSDGSVAVYSTTSSDARLDLFVPGGSAPAATRLDPAGSDGRLAFSGGVLYAATGVAGGLTLTRFRPGSLAAAGPPLSLDRPGTQDGGFVSALWPARGLGGVLAVVSIAPGEGIETSFATLLRADGTRADVELPTVLRKPLALSADGRGLLAGTQASELTSALDLGLLDFSLGADGKPQLKVTLAAHQQMPANVQFAASSLEGDRFYAVFGTEAGELE